MSAREWPEVEHTCALCGGRVCVYHEPDHARCQACGKLYIYLTTQEHAGRLEVYGGDGEQTYLLGVSVRRR